MQQEAFYGKVYKYDVVKHSIIPDGREQVVNKKRSQNKGADNFYDCCKFYFTQRSHKGAIKRIKK